MIRDGPNQLWVADITYFAVIFDAWSRKVVGYAIGMEQAVAVLREGHGVPDPIVDAQPDEPSERQVEIQPLHQEPQPLCHPQNDGIKQSFGRKGIFHRPAKGVLGFRQPTDRAAQRPQCPNGAGA